jgi:hypothetical protein
MDLVHAQIIDAVITMQAGCQVEQIHAGFKRVRRHVERVGQVGAQLTQKHGFPCSTRPEDRNKRPERPDRPPDAFLSDFAITTSDLPVLPL